MSESPWAERRIGDFLEAAFAGEWGSEPRPANASVLRATDLDAEGNVVGAGAPRSIPASKLLAKRLREGDILLEGSGGGPDKPVGRVGLFEIHVRAGPVLCSNFFRTLRPNRSVVDERFLWRKLQWFYRQPSLLAMQQQTTGIINLKFSEYLNARIEAPTEKSEQAKIAGILDTLDNVIRHTEAIIQKLKQVKRGLLHDLLTRGIDDNGELRPTASQQPDLYVDTPAGRVPTNWGVHEISELTRVTVGHVGPIEEHFCEKNDGVPLLSTTSIGQEGLVQGEHRRVTSDFDKAHPNSHVSIDDLLVARHGKSGSAAVVPAEIPAAQSLNVVIVRRCDSFDSAFLAAWLNHPRTRKELLGGQAGSVQAIVGTRAVASLPVALPSKAEQVEICARQETLQRRIQIEEHYRRSLGALRQGLMDDLLTGRVRVTPLLTQSN